ncbi:hypothetical protein B9479_000657 [Cryptococcus floricola]|uniref:Uncharacterized protein n=1 Tax=Cryptococcus floricola TaxID=2591691 RepID=A0A5D3B892_9TREE|nr:hypothetical protein B9479_000657 [Cryptococcus floricola]
MNAEEAELLKQEELVQLILQDWRMWWDADERLNYGEVAIRLLFWWDKPDSLGNRYYWQSTKYVFDHETRFRDILEEFIGEYMSHVQGDPRPEEFDLDWSGYESFLSHHLSPSHYIHMVPIATIVIDPK